MTVASAFCILGVVMAIFAIVGYDLFSERAPIEFGTFSRSLFTMFQVSEAEVLLQLLSVRVCGDFSSS